MNLKQIELVEALSQEFYDSYNNFMISSDIKLFGKLLARILIFDMVKDVPGDIVELGVFKGTGIFTFLKLKRFFCPNSMKKVIGFDFFDTEELTGSIKGNELQSMSTLFKDRNFTHDKTFVTKLKNKISSSGFLDYEFDLIKGDVSITTEEFVVNNPGSKISLLYIDLDLEEPTYNSLNALWNNISRGGIVVFDEYAYHKWTESIGVDRFFEDKDVQIKSLNFMAPTAYIIKK
jgi:hypothetical protein